MKRLFSKVGNRITGRTVRQEIRAVHARLDAMEVTLRATADRMAVMADQVKMDTETSYALVASLRELVDDALESAGRGSRRPG